MNNYEFSDYKVSLRIVQSKIYSKNYSNMFISKRIRNMFGKYSGYPPDNT